MNTYIFDMQQHSLLDGTMVDIPVALAEDGRELSETRSLIAAAAIIGAAMNTGEQGSLDELVAEVGGIVSGAVENGVVVEDDLGAGSVSITPEESLVEVRQEGVTAVPSDLMYDMLSTWNRAQNDSGENEVRQNASIHRKLGGKAIEG